MIGAVLGSAIVHHRIQPRTVAQALAAVRYACDHYEAGGPLAHCVDVLMEVLEEQLNRATAARAVTSLFGALDDEDRATVTRRLLDQ